MLSARPAPHELTLCRPAVVAEAGPSGADGDAVAVSDSHAMGRAAPEADNVGLPLWRHAPYYLYPNGISRTNQTPLSNLVLV